MKANNYGGVKCLRGGLGGASSFLIGGDRGIEVDSLEDQHQDSLDGSQQYSAHDQKLAAFDNMKDLYCKKQVDATDANLRVHKQYQSSQQVLMQILDTPDNKDADHEKNGFQGEEEGSAKPFNLEQSHLITA